MDNIQVQVRFRKGIFICTCGQEDIIDWNVRGGNTYDHNCSACGKWNNDFKDYSGCLMYSPEEYKLKTAEEIETTKNNMCSDWLFKVKNPPKVVEPTKEELEQQKVAFENQKAYFESKLLEVTAKIKEKVIAEALEEQK